MSFVIISNIESFWSENQKQNLDTTNLFLNELEIYKEMIKIKFLWS